MLALDLPGYRLRLHQRMLDSGKARCHLGLLSRQCPCRLHLAAWLLRLRSE